MTRLKNIYFWVGLGLYGMLLFMLFTLYRLPADKLLGKALTLWSETQARVSAETVSFSLPLSYSLQKTLLEAHWPRGVSKDRIDSLVFGPEWSRLLSGSLPLKTEVDMARGRMVAGLGVPFLGRGYFYAKASSVHLEDVSVLAILLDRRLSGKSEAEMQLLGDVRFPLGLNGWGFLRITDGSLESKLPLAGLRTIPFRSISASAVIQKGVLFVSDGKLDGPAVSGTFAGEIKLDERLNRSLLNITANLYPGPMLKENDMARQMVASLAAEGKPIIIRLQGSLSSPSIKLEKD